MIVHMWLLCLVVINLQGDEMEGSLRSVCSKHCSAHTFGVHFAHSSLDVCNEAVCAVR